MSILKVSDIEWEYTFVNLSLGFNDCYQVLATKNGLEIEGDIIPWEEIEKAMIIVKERAENG